MSAYIGHCNSCDVVLEGEELVESLLQKYNKKKVYEILNYAIYDLENKDKWKQETEKEIEIDNE